MRGADKQWLPASEPAKPAKHMIRSPKVQQPTAQGSISCRCQLARNLLWSGSSLLRLVSLKMDKGIPAISPVLASSMPERHLS